MANNPNLANYVNNGSGYDNNSTNGMTVEQIAYIQAKIEKYADDAKPFYKQFAATTVIPEGHKEMTYRKHFRPEITSHDLTPLVEGQGTYTDQLKVGSFTVSVDNYGGHRDYTKESKQFNFDDVVELCTNDFKYKVVEIPEKLRLNALLASTFTATGESTMVATLDKIRIILTKIKAQAWEDGKFMVCMPPEGVQKLINELKAVNQDLPLSMKESIYKDGAIYEYGRFLIAERPEDEYYNTSESGGHTGYKLIAISIDRDGDKPLIENEYKVELIHHPLGSGVVKDPTTGAIGNDTNNRVGSVAWNIDGFASASKSARACLVVNFGDTGFVDASSAPTAATGAVDTDAVPTSAA